MKHLITRVMQSKFYPLTLPIMFLDMIFTPFVMVFRYLWRTLRTFVLAPIGLWSCSRCQGRNPKWLDRCDWCGVPSSYKGT